MKLDIPIFYGQRKYIECEIRKPYPKILADAEEKANEGKLFSAMFSFVVGSIVSLTDEDEIIIDKKEKIKTICRNMKYKCIEHLIIEIMLLFDSDDAVEGFYSCPRCGQQKICEKTNEFDTRDHISDLEVNEYEDEKDYFEIIFEYPFEIKTKKGETLEIVNSVGFKHPNIIDYIQASAKVGYRNSTKLSIEVYSNCIIEINNKEIDKQWRYNYGRYMLENLEDIKKDLSKIAKEINRYGLQTKIEKVCEKCGKIWKENLNTANFFVSALQLPED